MKATARPRRRAGWLALVPCAALVVAAAACAAPDPARTATQPAAGVPGAWGLARQVPGTQTMSQQDTGNDGKALVATAITSVTCTAPGDCAASGGFVDSGFNFQVFVADQHAGTWSAARPLPGAAALAGNGHAAGSDEMGTAFLSQVSCSSPGNCALAGNYQVNDAREQTSPLLGTERAGVWGQADAIGQGASATALAVSCPRTAGACAAGGQAQDGAFVVSQKDGAWKEPQLVSGADGPVTSISCPSAGDCLAGGLDGPPDAAFIVGERDGRWGPARPVPGLSLLTRAARGSSALASVSCAAPGDCAAGGRYVDHAGHTQVFVAGERGGVWGRAEPLPGLAALNQGGRAGLTQVACGSAGTCAAGGWYLNLKGRDRQQAWVAAETGGRWGPAEKVPGTTALNTFGNAEVTAVSCGPAGCVAGGWYSADRGAGLRTQSGFLVTEANGTWGTAAQVPGLAALNTGGTARVTAVSCTPSGWCAAVGDYAAGSAGQTRMFAVGQALKPVQGYP